MPAYYVNYVTVVHCVQYMKMSPALMVLGEVVQFTCSTLLDAAMLEQARRVDRSAITSQQP